MTAPKFYNANGTFTRYALACGYVEKTETPRGRIVLDMESPGSGVFHVRGFVDGDTWVWEVYETLGGARRAYREHARTLHA